MHLRVHPDVEPVVFVPERAARRPPWPARCSRSRFAWRTPPPTRGARPCSSHALGAAPEHLLAATRDWLHQEARRTSYAESMALVDALRAAGHAAVISGAGPSVLVLALRDRVG